jgi:hypothetical protein
MDLLLKRLDERAKFKEHMNNYTQAIDASSACEVCENGRHSENDCPETREDVAFVNNNNNNGYRPQGGQGWNQSHPPYQGGNNYNSNFNSNFNSNQPSLKDLVLGKAKINESLNKKLAANDKTLESCYRHNLARPEGGPRARWAQRIIIMGLRIGSCAGGLRPDWPCI